MLSEETRKALKSLTTVGNAAIVRYPWTSVLQKNKSVIAFMNLEDYGESEFEEFGLETMSEFLSLVDFYQDPNIEIEDGIISIESGKFHQKYATSDLDTMKSYDIKVTTLKKVRATPEIIHFRINKEEIQRFKKIASLTKANSLIIRSNPSGNEIVVCKLDRNNNLSDESVTEFPMTVSKDDVNIVVGIQNILKIPDKNYTVSVKQSEASGKCISEWDIEDEPISIIISINDIF